MSTEIAAKPSVTVQLDQILASAVVLNWAALASSSTPGRVRVEYHIGRDGSVECMKMWGSAREYWSLICDYTISGAWSDGPRFSNGFHSRPLARLLQAIMMNQALFGHEYRPNTHAVLEVGTPTLEETEDARLRVSETFQKAS
jgi:hypothetical protein